MKNIYLLWPTARPETFIKTLGVWFERAVTPECIVIMVAVDNQEHYDYLKDKGFEPELVVNLRKGITTPLYKLTQKVKARKNDIIVVPSDDFFPPKGWDKYLRETSFECLQVNDGHIAGIISMPVMTYKCLLKLNRIIYNPVYNHMWSDNELYDVVNELKLLKTDMSKRYVFEHKNPIFGEVKKDEVNESVNAGYFQMQEIYNKRKILPIEEKLKTFKLSILIASMYSREEMGEKLFRKLEPQLNGQVEVILNVDDGNISIGRKRNQLMKLANGEYVVFIDDDDMIPDNYVQKIFENMGKDCIGITVEMTTNGEKREMGFCSTQYRKWAAVDNKDGTHTYYRPIHHLCPVRRELAIQAKFPDVTSGEDRDYSMNLQPLLKSENTIEETMYYYRYVTGPAKPAVKPQKIVFAI